MNGTMPRHHAARVEAAIASGQAARSALVASWRRSSRLHHLDPGGRTSPMRLTEAE
ncbi:sigma-54-dependent Fis family transcriptional regulator, partial [Bradyrhizobium sp. PRIMUS42]|nr:sigma-54-dependent Fis family transcriptional regulator [Bradyrhizobium sp. PRIMUS42]